MKLYFKSILMHFKSELEYKGSFILNFIAQILLVFTYYFMILALFNKFSNIRGFTLYEVLLTFSIIQIGYATNELFARGVDRFDRLIISGEFDRILLRPRNALLQVLCSQADIAKVFRILQGIVILVIALIKLNIKWNIYKIIVLALMLLSSILIFFSLFLLCASYCFFTIQGLEIRNAITDGGKNIAQYPVGVFKKGIVFLLTYIFPYAFVNYYPLLYFLGRTDYILCGLSPIIVVIYLIISLIVFKLGMKKYASTGS